MAEQAVMRLRATVGILLACLSSLLGQAPQTEPLKRQWFHHTRCAVMPGYDYTGLPALGLSVLHASGVRATRHLGAGLVLGVEHYEPFNGAIGIYPVMAEVRTWMDASRRVQPFAALDLGYGFPTKAASWGQLFDYKGGIACRALLGYRIGKHLSIQGGLSIQRWQRRWAFPGLIALDTITYKRLVLGFGVQL